MGEETTLAGLCAHAPAPKYQGVTNESRYLTMRDGVKIAVDIMRPLGVPEGTRLPVLLIMARYWRSFELRLPDPPKAPLMGPREETPKFFLERGFALVVVDGRGMGASHGVSRAPFAPEELEDYAEVARWVLAQDWCNGALGAYGISYEGATALRLAGVGVDAVRAVIPQEIEFDVYTDVALPGGVFNTAFIRAWDESNRALDAGKPSSLFPFLARLVVRSVRPTDDDRPARAQLAQAWQAHRANTNVHHAMSGVTYKDDSFASVVSLDDMGVYPYLEAIEANGTPIFSWGSWLDGATADAALRTFNSLSNPQIAVIGAWKHEMTANASPYGTPKDAPDPTPAHRWAMMAQFFADNLRDGAPTSGKELYYTTLGKGGWQKSDCFPPANVRPQAWYLHAGGGLSHDAPSHSAHDRYTVDFSATTGTQNRWQTQMARPVHYRDRAQQDRRLLTYTSAPLESELEVTGYPVVYLHVASSHEDCAFFVYLEDVDPQGVVRYVTEGQLRAMHRHISPAPAPYGGQMPHHTFLQADASALPIGEVVELCIGLQPTSVLFRKGHRVRLAIAGADADTFARVPSHGTPEWRVSCGAPTLSRVVLPVVWGM
jgi:putative CocE/NonD family hydrolase